MGNTKRRFDLIDVHEFDDYILSQEEILEYFFEPCNAVWFHDGDPSRPHVELTSGFCSDGYINCSEVLSHEKLNRMLAHQLFLRLREAGVTYVDWVVGSDHAAATFSSKVAEEFALRLDLDVRHDFTEKHNLSNGRGQTHMQWKRLHIEAGAVVLQVEELVTTRKTLEDVKRAIEKGNPHHVVFHPVKGTIILRPARVTNEYDDIVALVRKEIGVFQPVDCPLCKAGSKRLRPKYHWLELMEK